MTYRALLDEAIGQSPPTSVDIDVIIARERRRRHRLRSGAVIGAAVSVAVVAGLPPLLGAVDTPPGRHAPGRPAVPRLPGGEADHRAGVGAARATGGGPRLHPERPADRAHPVRLLRDPGRRGDGGRVAGPDRARHVVRAGHLRRPPLDHALPGWPTFAGPGERSTVRLTLAGLSGPAPAGMMAVGVGSRCRRRSTPSRRHRRAWPRWRSRPRRHRSQASRRVELTADAAAQTPLPTGVGAVGRADDPVRVVPDPGPFRVEVDGRPARRPRCGRTTSRTGGHQPRRPEPVGGGRSDAGARRHGGGNRRRRRHNGRVERRRGHEPDRRLAPASGGRSADAIDRSRYAAARRTVPGRPAISRSFMGPRGGDRCPSSGMLSAYP